MRCSQDLPLPEGVRMGTGFMLSICKHLCKQNCNLPPVKFSSSLIPANPEVNSHAQIGPPLLQEKEINKGIYRGVQENSS